MPTSTLITLPPDIASVSFYYAKALFSDMWPFISIAVGILVALAIFSIFGFIKIDNSEEDEEE